MIISEKPKKKIPERKCIGCGESGPKSSLFRVVRSPEGTISLDFTGKISGRGAYICKKTACLRKVRKSNRLERNLDCEIPETVYNQLEKEMSENGG